MSNSRVRAVVPAEAKKNENDTHLILPYGKGKRWRTQLGFTMGSWTPRMAH